MPRVHQAGFSRRSLAAVGLFESVRCPGPGLALLTNEGMQQQQQTIHNILDHTQYFKQFFIISFSPAFCQHIA
ncbi:hypothetical protein TNCV_2644401 [Trichonephila clavipes]|nr:hypothetical protein TNCV_2644401 [Trichonephila clavipes]